MDFLMAWHSMARAMLFNIEEYWTFKGELLIENLFMKIFGVGKNHQGH